MQVFGAPTKGESVSPYTKTRSGFSRMIVVSIPISIYPFCSEWLPEPTPRWWSGSEL